MKYRHVCVFSYNFELHISKFLQENVTSQLLLSKQI